MNFLGALGAAGSGISAGVQDLDQMDQNKFRKEQQTRARKDWQSEDADNAAIAGIDPSVTGADRYRAMAAVLSKSGSIPQQVRAAQLSQAANQLESQDMAIRQGHVQNALGTAAFLHGAGDYQGALNVLNGAYGLVPDGHKFIVDNNNNTVGIANNSGKWVMPPQAINSDTVGKMIDVGQMYKNPDLWKTIKSVGQKDTELAQTGQHYNNLFSLGIGELNNKNAHLGLEQDKFNAEKPLYDAHANFYNSGANLHNAQAGAAQAQAESGKVVGTPVQMIGADGQPMLGITTIGKKGLNVSPISMPEGSRFMKQPAGLKADTNGNYISDSGDLFRVDPKSNTLVPILNPGNIKSLADGIAANLPGNKTAAPSTPATPAAPAPDTTRYIRSKGPRGGYNYTLSTRGKTKAEWAAQDADSN